MVIKVIIITICRFLNLYWKFEVRSERSCCIGFDGLLKVLNVDKKTFKTLFFNIKKGFSEIYYFLFLNLLHSYHNMFLIKLITFNCSVLFDYLITFKKMLILSLKGGNDELSTQLVNISLILLNLFVHNF